MLYGVQRMSPPPPNVTCFLKRFYDTLNAGLSCCLRIKNNSAIFILSFIGGGGGYAQFLNNFLEQEIVFELLKDPKR